MSRYVVGTQIKDGEVIYVKAPANDAQEGTCAWCGGGFDGGDGDMRCIAMLTQMEDGCWDWYSGEYIHGECDYVRHDATMAQANEGGYSPSGIA